jgi:hypothetical protein
MRMYWSEMFWLMIGIVLLWSVAFLAKGVARSIATKVAFFCTLGLMALFARPARTMAAHGGLRSRASIAGSPRWTFGERPGQLWFAARTSQPSSTSTTP